MAGKHRTFTAELKREAVQLLATSGKPGTQIARELGIPDSAFYYWRRQLVNQGDDAFPGKGHQTPLEEELRQLRRENERLRQERAIVKKPSASSAIYQINHDLPVHRRALRVLSGEHALYRIRRQCTRLLCLTEAPA